MYKWKAAFLAIVAFTLCASVRAHEHEEKGDAHKDEAVPQSYSAAVESIEHHSEAIAKLIKDGKLDGLHHEGEIIKKIAETLPKLAMKDDSGVAKTDVKEINLTSKALAAKYEPLDEAGDAGKKEESQKVHGEMIKLIETLKKFSKAADKK